LAQDMTTNQRTERSTLDPATIVSDLIEARLAPAPPRATYRLQFNHTFTFKDATAIVPYLADLGISHVYASPIFRASPGSMHGYDVVDYGELNPEIGTREEFDTLVAALHEVDLKLILDFVPNHMGIDGGSNPWWQDVLENGAASPYAATFDIDWDPVKVELRNKVLLPILGDQYGLVLERGELKMVYDNGSFRIDYGDMPLPINPLTYPEILRTAEQHLGVQLQPDDLDMLDFLSIVTSLERLPTGDETPLNEESIQRRIGEQIVAKRRLADLCERSAVIRESVSVVVAALNGLPNDARSFDRLDQLLGKQNWRLAFWRVASEEINYRRFFAINTLAAIRQEELGVFKETHRLLFSLLAEGAVDGVRIDHPDGLWEPAGYFRDLQRGYLLALLERNDRQDDESWSALREATLPAIEDAFDRIASEHGRWPLYVVAEKILEHTETLPGNWAIAGTVGYEFAQAATELFVDTESRVIFDRIFTRYTGDKIRFPELVYEMKGRQLREAFASEVNVLTNALNRISEHDRHSRDFTNADLRVALREILACLSVYRTYVTGGEEGLTDRDQRYIEAAIALAVRRNPTLDRSVFDFVARTLISNEIASVGDPDNERSRFTMKFQQLSGPVMAKGLEDTAFSRFNRLVSLNEVGGDPSRFGMNAEDFHRQNRVRLRAWPHSMLASSTHDTKRGEDVRARISVLSEVPTEWRAALNRWSRLNRKLKQKIDGSLAPHRADEYVIYQTLIGTWPLVPLTAASRAAYVARLQDYIIKVAREASRFTNWVNPDEAYEFALTGFVAGLLASRRSKLFLADFEAFVDQLVAPGLTNALAQQVLKLTSPGVPDIYQGTELWDDSLVDPDNRRPIDFGTRATMLAHVRDRMDGHPVAALTDDSIKMTVTARTLQARSEHPDLFAHGDYLSLPVEGPMASRIVAYARVLGDDAAIVVVPRLVKGLTSWEGTSVLLPDTLAGTHFLERFSQRPFEAVDADGARLCVGDLFVDLPVALLTARSRDELDKNGTGEKTRS